MVPVHRFEQGKLLGDYLREQWKPYQTRGAFVKCVRIIPHDDRVEVRCVDEVAEGVCQAALKSYVPQSPNHRAPVVVTRGR
jgi:hypothetical protein